MGHGKSRSRDEQTLQFFLALSVHACNGFRWLYDLRLLLGQTRYPRLQDPRLEGLQGQKLSLMSPQKHLVLEALLRIVLELSHSPLQLFQLQCSVYAPSSCSMSRSCNTSFFVKKPSSGNGRVFSPRKYPWSKG